MKRQLLALSLALLCASTTIAAAHQTSDQDPKTVVTDQAAKRRLLGRHMFSMQWVSWDYFGRVDVTERNGTLYVKGEQRSRENDDFVTIEGRVTRVDAREFGFNGRITTRVSYINNGEPCVREGDMTFAISGQRRYWRLQQMDNPCDAVTDYVDIYFRR